MEVFLVIILLIAIPDLSSSVFIITSLTIDAFQKKSVSPLNQILISLNVSNVSFTIVMSVYLATNSIWSYLYRVGFVFPFISYVTVCTITSSAWLTAALCFFYFTKIAPPWPGLLMKIKSKINVLTWRLILLVETVSLSVSFLSLAASGPHPNEKNSTAIEVETLENKMKKIKISNVVLVLNFLPFTLIIIMTVTSAWFLRVYDHQMKTNGTLVNTNVKDYQSAVHTMMGLLVLYLITILAIVLMALETFVDYSVGSWICLMILLLFPTGQSTLLIYSNPKLKQNLREQFNLLSCRA
ncbi:taste receptor type 2 member 39-like [Engystomops pustulosus]|uniref:taste receptor type 2 member 39-like n=1 Tax=Engystomops pustulosus TaxID=76066 RepID=UPI003AFA5982